MFDVGFGELVLIFLVALVVLGPERLPKAAATMGRFAGRARGYLRGFMQQLENEAREIDPRDDLKKWQQDLSDDITRAPRSSNPDKPSGPPPGKTHE